MRILNPDLKLEKIKLILLTLGPIVIILAYNLYKAGYHVVDVEVSIKNIKINN